MFNPEICFLYSKEDYKMTDEEEKEKIQNEIKQLNREIQETKETMYRYYTLKRKSTVLEISDDVPQNSHEPDVDLDIYFYENLLKFHLKDDESLFTLLFPFKGKSVYGLNIKKIQGDKYNVENIYLPPSVSIKEVNVNINQSNFDKVLHYLEDLHENIYAYYMREEHLKQLKKIMSPTIFLYHNHKFTHIELTFKIFNTQTKIRKSVTLKIYYDLYSVQPNKVSCKVNFEKGDDLEELDELFTKHFQIMATNDLVTGYLATFQDFDVYKFFV